MFRYAMRRYLFFLILLTALQASASVLCAGFPPVPGKGPTDTICKGDTISLSASNPLALSYTWSPNYHISSTSIANPSVWPDTSTTYTVTITGITSNLITNGNFSLGNSGFISSYSYTTNLWPEATYYVGSNPTTYHPNFASCPDHTTGTGNMMIVNGASNANTVIWQQNVSVVPNASYVFSCWLTSVTPTYPAQLQFFVNNVQIGPVFQATNVNCNWNMFYNTWNSGAATTATIVIKNQNTALSGNDFAIDDLYFAQLVQIVDPTLIVVEDPVVSLGNDTSICSNDTIYMSAGSGYSQYQWSNGMTGATIPVFSPGQYWVDVTTANGCHARDTVLVSLNPAPVAVTVNDSVCLGDTASLSVAPGPGWSYLWSNGDTGPGIQVSPPSTTTYTLQITDPMGCSSTSSATAYIHPLPVVNITADTAICFGTSVILSASGGIGYLWNPGGNTMASITVTPTAPSGTYSVTVTDSNACEGIGSVDVNTIPLPVISIVKDPDTLCLGQSATLTAGGGNAYSWSTGDNTAAITVSPVNQSTFSVTVTNSSGNTSCSSDTSFMQVVKNCVVIYIPNAISLSGLNRTFKPVGEFVGSEEYHLAIYNRWGQLIFETNDFNEAWDGTDHGEYVPEGVYVYDITVENGFTVPFRTQGTVTVLR